MTGTPDYVSTVKTGQFPKVLRNIHVPAMCMNAPIMLLILAVLPLEAVNGGANVLSLLAEHVSSSSRQKVRNSIVNDIISFNAGGWKVVASMGGD